ncbi:hypothetical protein UU7_07973, partial [Rhodanobacter spathiphylli B39]
MKHVLSYSFALAWSGGVGQIAFSGVRIFIGRWHGDHMLGIYSALYDIVQRSIVAYMQVVNTAAFPMMRKYWDEGRVKELGIAAQENILLLTVPSLWLLALLAGSMRYWISHLNIRGDLEEFAMLLTAVGIGIVANRVRTFHFDSFLLLRGRAAAVLRNTLVSTIFLVGVLIIFGRDMSLLAIGSAVAASYLLGLTMSVLSLIRYSRLPGVNATYMSNICVCLALALMATKYDVHILWVLTEIGLISISATLALRETLILL